MPVQLKLYAVIFAALVGSIFFGVSFASGDYGYLKLLIAVALIVAAIIIPGYEFLLALGMLAPIAVPLPWVYGLPFLLVVLMFCWLKVFVTSGMIKSRVELRPAVNFLILLFFTWVFIRYCMNPVLPGLAIGSGKAITGFRAYLNYGICFVLLLSLSAFLREREQLLRFFRWTAYLSILFAALFIPLTFTKSGLVAQTLSMLGVYLTFFDNGWLRFITLGGFGLGMLTFSLFPKLLPLELRWRILLGAGGIIAIVLAGSRSSVLIAIVTVCAVTLVRRRMAIGLATIGAVVLLLFASKVMADRFHFYEGVGFYRVAALVSNRVAEQSDAASTVLWRKVRWERAMIDIRRAPWVGVGYGGLESAFTTTRADSAQAAVEIDVASGSIHNGYLAAARAFGIPFAVLYILIIVSRIIHHARQVRRNRDSDPVLSDVHCFVLISLIGMVLSLYIGADLNTPSVWLPVGLGFLADRFTKAKAHQEQFVPESSRRFAGVPRVAPA